MNKIHSIDRDTGQRVMSGRLTSELAMSLSRETVAVTDWAKGVFVTYARESLQNTAWNDIDTGGAVAPGGDPNAWLIGTFEAIARLAAGRICFEDWQASASGARAPYSYEFDGEVFWVSDPARDDLERYWQGVWFNAVSQVTGFVLPIASNEELQESGVKAILTDAMSRVHAVATSIFDGQTYLVWQRCAGEQIREQIRDRPR